MMPAENLVDEPEFPEPDDVEDDFEPADDNSEDE